MTICYLYESLGIPRKYWYAAPREIRLFILFKGLKTDTLRECTTLWRILWRAYVNNIKHLIGINQVLSHIALNPRVFVIRYRKGELTEKSCGKASDLL